MCFLLLKAVLLSVNARYIHSSLAPWLLAEGTAHYSRFKHEVKVIETTIKQENSVIAEQTAADSPDVVGIGAYIWNAAKLPELLRLLRLRLPDAVFVLGGPETSHNAEYWLGIGVDFVVRGEGERAFPQLLDALAEGDDEALRSFCEGTLIAHLQSPVDPYSSEYFEALDGRIAYIEASRGCYNNCAYCLSAGEKVRFFSLEMIKDQIYKLSRSGAKTVKFIDRTFNSNAARAYELLEYVIGLDTSCHFHFEAAPDLFDEQTLTLLAAAPPGRIQIELGIQSFNKRALEAVSRRSDLAKAEDNIRILTEMRNIHVHVSLIAGLPYETLSSFKNTFNRAHALNPHMLQLGFLKLLHGSRLRSDAKELGIKYSDEPPYEIISSPWLSPADLDVLKQAESALEHTYNKARFLSLIEYVLSAEGLDRFSFYASLGKAIPNHAIPPNIYVQQIIDFCAGLPNSVGSKLNDCAIRDLLRSSKGKNIPRSLRAHGTQRKEAIRTAERFLGRVIDRDEAAVLSTGEIVFVDSNKRDPVTGLYELYSG